MPFNPEVGQPSQATLQGNSPGRSDWGSRGRQRGVSGWDWKPRGGQGSPDSRALSKRATCTPQTISWSAGKIGSSDAGPRHREENGPSCPKMLPLPDQQEEKTAPHFSVFWEEQVELVAVETGRKPRERWRVGHLERGPGLERWGRVREVGTWGKGIPMIEAKKYERTWWQ